MQNYVVMVIDADEDRWEQMTPEQRQQTYDTDALFGARLAERGGRITGGQELDHSQRGLVVRRGREGDPLRTHGPYAESTEQIVGFYIVESPDEEALLEACELMLPAHHALEIRPVPRAEG